ncbi:MAG: efflux RND transporter periplasmic adaptor subunit [Cytophagales bacterium]
MTKKLLRYFFLSLFIVVFVYTGYFLFQKSQQKPIVFETELPVKKDIVVKTMATGSVLPQQEVQVKSQITGVIEAIFVEPGQVVAKGQLLAKVTVVPNLVSVNTAENNLANAKIAFELAEKELKRFEKLVAQNAATDQEYQRVLNDFKTRKENVEAGEANLQLLRDGASRKGKAQNLIYSPVSGTVLDVPVKIGSSVIERNNFNEGTTICLIADMGKLIFEGKVDESEVGKIKIGMPLVLRIGAIDGKTFNAKLDFISPKGVIEDGAIKFLIKATLMFEKGELIRAGYSANADIVLEKKENVLALKESLLQFSNDSVYVEIETNKEQVFEKRLLKLGISDNFFVEVLDGLKETDKIKVPIAHLDKNLSKPKERPSSGSPRQTR